MLDLNQLINQNKTLRRYQGTTGPGVVPTQVVPDGAVLPTEVDDKGGYYGRTLPEVEVQADRFPAYSESLEDRNAKYSDWYAEYLASGNLPENFIPYGQIEFGYDGGDYVDYSSEFASVWRTDDKTKERYDTTDVPMSEWLFGVVESEGDRKKRTVEKNKVNAPKTSDYDFSTFDGKSAWQNDTEAYWSKIEDEEMSSKSGWFKDTDGSWKPVSTNDIIEAYNTKRNALLDEESRVGIASGDRSTPGTPAVTQNPGIGANDLIAAALAVPAVLEPTPMGEAAWAAWAAKNAPAIAAAGLTAGMLWNKLTESGQFSDMSIQNQNILKARFESLQSIPLNERVWEEVNGVQGIYVNTNAGEIFVSRDRVADLYGIPGQAEAHEAAQGAGATTLPPWAIPGDEKWIDADGDMKQMDGEEWKTMTPEAQHKWAEANRRYKKSQAQMSEDPGGEEPDPDKDKSRWRRYWEKTKGWGKHKVDKLSKANQFLKDINPYGKTFLKDLKSVPWKDASAAVRFLKVYTLNRGNTMAGRWVLRLTHFHAADSIQAKFRDTKTTYTRMTETEKDIFSEKDKTFTNMFLETLNDDSLSLEDKGIKLEKIAEDAGEDYFIDSVYMQAIKHSIPSDSLHEFESGYKEYGTDTTRSKKDYYKKGGLVHTASNQIRQFQEGGIMSRLQSYQGNTATGLPAGYEGVESPYPAITAPNSTYTDMVDWGGNTQPGVAGLNEHGFQNYDDWRSFMKTVDGFKDYDWKNTTHWGIQHQDAWDWTKSNRSASTLVNDNTTGNIDNNNTGNNTDNNGGCGGDGSLCSDGQGGCVPCTHTTTNTTNTTNNMRTPLTEEQLLEMRNTARNKMFMDKGSTLLAGAASIAPAWMAWNQANKMETEAGEFHEIPDVKSPQVHIKAPINEINMQIEDLDDQMNMTVENLKAKGASASAILAAEKQRRTGKATLNAKKEDLLLKADAQSQKLTTGYAMDAAKQNQVKNIKMKLEEMDFRTATKKAKIDILQKLTNTVSGIILDEKKMYSDKNIAAIVTSALTAGTGMMERQRLLEMMYSLGITDDMIKRNGGGDLYEENA